MVAKGSCEGVLKRETVKGGCEGIVKVVCEGVREVAREMVRREGGRL